MSFFFTALPIYVYLHESFKQLYCALERTILNTLQLGTFVRYIIPNVSYLNVFDCIHKNIYVAKLEVKFQY